MADPMFICTAPTLPYSCTYISSSPENVVSRLVASHIGIALFRRRYGAEGLAQLPIAVTLQPLPANAAVNVGLPVFVCDTCEVYFVHARAYIEHVVTDAAHAQESAAAIDQVGEFQFEDLMLADHARLLVLGAPAPQPAAAAAAPPPLRRRLMINFTGRYSHAPCSVNLPANLTTIAELTNILQAAYGHHDANPIDWATVWLQGVVFLYSTSEGGSGRMTVADDTDVVVLVGKMDFGECCIGGDRRG